jgi:hypothetical protein
MECVKKLINEQFEIKLRQLTNSLVADTLDQRCGYPFIVGAAVAVYPGNITKRFGFETIGSDGYVSCD